MLCAFFVKYAQYAQCAQYAQYAQYGKSYLRTNGVENHE